MKKLSALTSFILLMLCCAIAHADNHSDQMNPNNDAYWESRGYDDRPDDWEDQASSSSSSTMFQEYDDNRANQLNSNNDAYWQSRGYDERPDDEEDQGASSGSTYEYWESRGIGRARPTLRVISHDAG